MSKLLLFKALNKLELIMIDFLDLFGEPLKFNYNRKYLFKTSLSAVISLLVIITLASYAIYNIYTMLQFNTLTMNNYQTIMSADDPLYSLNNSNFYLAFQLFDTSQSIKIFHENSNYSQYFTFEPIYYDNNVNKSLNVTRCDNIDDAFVATSDDTMCLNFNNSQLGGNYFSSVRALYVSTLLYFNYSQFMLDYNNSIDINSIFPLRLFIFYPYASLNPLNFSYPYAIGVGNYYLTINFNKSKYYEMSSTVVNINTDSSFIVKSNEAQNVFTSNFKQYSEEGNLNDQAPLLDLRFYIDPIKIVYNRRYMKLQDVLNNVSSLSNVLLMILAIICRKYNSYMLKVDFIEENIMFKGDEKFGENTLKINVNTAEEPVRENRNDSQHPIQLKKKLDVRPPKKIRMNSFFECVNCCKSKKSFRKLLSDAADEFFSQFVDAKNIILLLAQIKELKNATLPKYQNVILSGSKIILNPNEKMKVKQHEMSYQKCLQKLKTKILQNEYNSVDLMLINKF